MGNQLKAEIIFASPVDKTDGAESVGTSLDMGYLPSKFVIYGMFLLDAIM